MIGSESPLIGHESPLIRPGSPLIGQQTAESFDWAGESLDLQKPFPFASRFHSRVKRSSSLNVPFSFHFFCIT